MRPLRKSVVLLALGVALAAPSGVRAQEAPPRGPGEAPGQPDTAGLAKVGTIPVRIVGGRLVAGCDLSTRRRRVPANLFIDLEVPAGLQLHNRVVGPGALEAEVGGERLPITIHFPGFDITVPRRGLGPQEVYEDFTKYHSAEIGENALVGTIGAQLLQQYHLVLDIGDGKVELSEPREPGAVAPPVERGAETVPIAIKSDVAWLPVRFADGRLASMGLGTARHDTLLDSVLCERLGHPAGDVGEVNVGAFDLSRYVAFRPGDVYYDGPDGAAGFVGLGLLRNLRVEIDVVNRRATLRESAPPDFPAADLAFFQAMVEDESAPLLAYLDAHPESRCAPEAAELLLDLCVEEDAGEEALRTAVEWLRKTRVEDLRATAALDLCEELASSGHVEEAVLVAESGIPDGRDDRYPETVHKLHARIGALLLDAGEGKRAWKHLLSAAFGTPEDGLVNLHLGRYYEQEGRLERAFSRYVQASIQPESGAQAVEGLARVQKELGGDTLSVADIERLIEGKILKYTAATKYEPDPAKATNRVSLVEFFTSPHIEQGGQGGALANEGVLTHFEREHVAALTYHLPGPELSPLTNALAAAQARYYGVGRPVHVIDGAPKTDGLARKSDSEQLYRDTRQAVRIALLETSDYEISVDAAVEDGVVKGESDVVGHVLVKGPARAGTQLVVILAERGVLFPGKSKVVVHRMVARGALTPSLEGEPFEPVDGEMRFPIAGSLNEITMINEAYLGQLQSGGAGSVPMVSTRIDPGQVTIVAYLRDVASKKVLQAAQVNPRGAEPDEADE